MATAPVTQQPPLDQLLEAAEIDGDAWRSYCEWHPSDEDDNISRMGVHIETWYVVHKLGYYVDGRTYRYY